MEWSSNGEVRLGKAREDPLQLSGIASARWTTRMLCVWTMMSPSRISRCVPCVWLRLSLHRLLRALVLTVVLFPVSKHALVFYFTYLQGTKKQARPQQALWRVRGRASLDAGLRYVLVGSFVAACSVRIVRPLLIPPALS